MESAWQWFDYVMWLAAKSSPDDLKAYVANPGQFANRRAGTVIMLSDQIPVWLKTAPSSRLVPRQMAMDRRLAKRARTSRAQVALHLNLV